MGQFELTQDLFLERFAVEGISRPGFQPGGGQPSLFQEHRMKNRALNPAYALALCYAGMVCLAIAVNLMPYILTTLRVDLGGRAGLTGEQLGRISAITFAGLVGGSSSLAP